MSIKNKIKNAKLTNWLSEGLSKSDIKKIKEKALTRNKQSK
jgi:hypothetical protein